jgi:hypothetical protein
LEYIVSPQALGTRFRKANQPETVVSLSDKLSTAISECEEHRIHPEVRLKWAQHALTWINKAFACGLIQEGQGLVNKNKKLEAKNAELEGEVITLLKENAILRDNMEKLKDAIAA